MKKKVLAGIMTTAMIMAMMTGCGSSDTAKDTQASTGSGNIRRQQCGRK